jgi:hypothetical protein
MIRRLHATSLEGTVSIPENYSSLLVKSEDRRRHRTRRMNSLARQDSIAIEHRSPLYFLSP